MTDLQAWGVDSYFFARAAALGFDPTALARVVEVQRDRLRLMGERGEFFAKVSGRLAHASAENAAALPVVGDVVTLRGDSDQGLALVDEVMTRRTILSRKAAGDATLEQVIAANVDGVLVVTSLNHDFNDRRLERYLAAVRSGGGDPMVILTKGDLMPPQEAVAEAARVAAEIAFAPTVAVSVISGLGLDQLKASLAAGKTYCLVGSSGVGKSTLTNWLLETEVQVTQAIGAGFDKGRHTTTARSLFRLPSGALLIDTPGMREFMPWAADEGTSSTFPEIESLAMRCRYGDCAHDGEPGCEVQAAISAGTLTMKRLGSYRKMLREQAWLMRKTDTPAAVEEKKKWKKIHKEQKRRYRNEE